MSKKNIILEEGGLVKKEQGSKTGIRLLISFILTIMLVIAIIVVRNKLTEKEQECTIIKSIQPIAENFLVTNENFSDFFVVDEVVQSDLPVNSVTKKSDLIGKFFVSAVTDNTIITSLYVTDEKDILQTMDTPIVSGISVDSASNMVNGILRTGDIVDLIFYSENERVYIIENVYITQVFDANGREISRNDKETVASKVNVYIEADYSLRFAEHLQNDTLYINKVNYNTSEKLFIASDENLITVPTINPDSNTESDDESNLELPNVNNDTSNSNGDLNYNEKVEE